jgi:predicted AAA+ superfamily ATPase
MIPRKASSTLLRLSKGFPIVAITGPRQSGKTTLAKAFFYKKPM